jgi:hypothetical protein
LDLRQAGDSLHEVLGHLFDLPDQRGPLVGDESILRRELADGIAWVW